MTLPPSHAEIEELARMALAAMDGESWCLPLDYLQGHKDGLEWAAQLAEANHPETGDWLYDDPIELAKAIRKGPDMPPAQPVAGSEPDRNPVLAYADSYRDMAKQGVESVPIWSVITDLERNIAPLYRHAQQPVVPDYPETLPCPVLLEPGLRFGKGVKTRLVLDAIQRRAEHSAELEAMTPEERAEYDAGIEEFKAMLPQPAQPAPVVPDDVLDALQKVARIRLDMNDFDGDRRGIADCLGDAEETLIEVVNRRAAMLNHPSSIQPNTGAAPGTEIKHPSTNSPAIPDGKSVTASTGIPVIPDGYVMVPKEPTAEMIAAAMNCDDVLFNSDESFCVQFGNIYETMLAAAPQEVR
ncbi:MAG: hypothetical protein ACLSIS_20435 [Klebsiella michiganensis]